MNYFKICGGEGGGEEEVEINAIFTSILWEGIYPKK